MTELHSTCDVVVIGGGQAGLAAGFYLRRAGLDFVILDDQPEPGGAWRQAWSSLRLFSPAKYSSLPGWPMPTQAGEPFPTAAHVVGYLREYEHRYQLAIRRPVRVRTVRDLGAQLAVDTDTGSWTANVVISATGTWWRPYVPYYPGSAEFLGRQIHTVAYRDPVEFAGQRVVVVGAGNSAAQILAEVSTVADTLWTTRRTPHLLPDDVDGRVLFETATRRVLGASNGDGAEAGKLGDIVVVPSVKAARDRGALKHIPMFSRLTAEGVAWADGRVESVDAVIWCTGFRPSIGHLAGLGLTRVDGHVATSGTRSADDDRLHLLGYGNWTGTASATLVGAGRTAKQLVAHLTARRQSTTGTF